MFVCYKVNAKHENDVIDHNVTGGTKTFAKTVGAVTLLVMKFRLSMPLKKC